MKLLNGKIVEIPVQNLEISFSGIHEVHAPTKGILSATLLMVDPEEIINQLSPVDILNYLGKEVVSEWLADEEVEVA